MEYGSAQPTISGIVPSSLTGSSTSAPDVSPGEAGEDGKPRQLFLGRFEGPWLSVLVIWALSWLVMAVWVENSGLGLPQADEYGLVGAATGQEPLSLTWLLFPANEHRAPLTRLELYLAGKLFRWNFRPILQINLGFLALGTLALLMALRSVRGQASLCDAFVCLLVFQPVAAVTIVCLSYAYAMALGLLCVALALALTGWAVRGRLNLALYFVLALAVDLAGGPAGHLWAVGLCGVVPLLWLRRKPLSWQLLALAGSLLVVGTSAAFLLTTPHVPQHEALFKPTPHEIFTTAWKQHFAWLGYPVLKVLWPWVTPVLIVPLGYLAVRAGRDLARLRKKERRTDRIEQWLDLVLMLPLFFSIAVVVAYARGELCLWADRYQFLLAPIALITYLLMVRLKAPDFIPGTLVIVMAVAVGWCWPEALRFTTHRRDRGKELIQALRSGNRPLSLLAEQYSDTTWSPLWGTHPLIHFWVELRAARVSVFRRMPRPDVAQAFPAKDAERVGPIALVSDPTTERGQALMSEAGPTGGTGQAIYRFHLPGGHQFQVWARMHVPVPGAHLALAVDDGPPQELPLPQVPLWAPVQLLPAVNLGPGEHQVAITLPSGPTRLDFLEIVPDSE
jgi:hypothetical protein